MNQYLCNTIHPLAESGPIFLPFGEWNYDGRVRQRLDRAHAEAIANELNARIARGEPGIPVYAGHPDVPELAARYPDKGALGWIESAALANENGRDGLALGVKWDRDPGRGFRWFSPYWVANERAGDTWIVSAISSLGLVNNPNIPEFRLANEADLNEPTPNKEPNMDKTKLIQLLGLAEDATDEDIVRAIKAGAKAVGELAEARAAADAAEAEKASLANERDEARAALANERAARRGLVLDRAVAERRIAEEGREAWDKLLAADFEAGTKALANIRVLPAAPAALPPAARVAAQTPATAGGGFTAPDGRAFANCAAYYETLSGKERRAFREAHFGELMDEARKEKAAKTATV